MAMIDRRRVKNAVILAVLIGAPTLWWFAPLLWDDCGAYRNALYLENGPRVRTLECGQENGMCVCYSGDRIPVADCSDASGYRVAEPSMVIECWDAGLAF